MSDFKLLVNDDHISAETQQPQGCRLNAVILSVSNLARAQAFYQSGLSMQNAVDVPASHDELKDICWLRAADGRGARLGLVAAKDVTEHSNAGKLVFYVKDVDRVAEELVSAGGELVLPPVAQPSLGGMRIGFVRGFDGQLIEFMGMPDAHHSYLSAVGISVGDLELSKEYYLHYLAWSKTHFLSVPEQYDEYIMVPPTAGSSALVLMCWQPNVNSGTLASPSLVFSSGDRKIDAQGCNTQNSNTQDPDGHRLLMV